MNVIYEQPHIDEVCLGSAAWGQRIEEKYIFFSIGKNYKLKAIFKDIINYCVKLSKDNILKVKARIKMKTELLMIIDYFFDDSEKIKRIVGGAEPYYSTNDLSWLDFNGKKVMIRTLKGDLL